MLVSRITLNGQGRLILRDNGKLIIPYEQFANAVMMKHLDGPRGIHLSAEGTIRAIMENFTVGKDYFGMEKEFIIEMVQNCPNPACRYYKTQAELSQKTAALGSVYAQDSEIASSTLTLRSNFSFNSEFQSTLNVSIASHSGVSLTDVSDNRNNSNQRSNNYSSALKKVNTKLNDSSSIVVPTSESYKLAEFLRTNPENYENFSNFSGLGNPGKELSSLDNGMWAVDAEVKSVRSTAIENGMYRKKNTHFVGKIAL